MDLCGLDNNLFNITNSYIDPISYAIDMTKQEDIHNNDLQKCKTKEERIKLFNSMRSDMDCVSRIICTVRPDMIHHITVSKLR